MLVPLMILSRKMDGEVTAPVAIESDDHAIMVTAKERKIIFFTGVGALLFVPVFKSITHLPPFLGILFGLSILWIVTELMHQKKEDKVKHHYSISAVLERIDTPSILFFLGILLAVAALQSAGHLNHLATVLNESIGNIWWINIFVGFLSSVVDNVPLVAGAIGMYDLNMYAQDHTFWELLAYCAGTGGSCLIIGSAAGVAIMGILKIDFIWYVKKISLLATAGYLSGVLVFWLMDQFMG
jgi:Na+/H+ antiporter NhaD/arsenite permease-like protein